MNSFRFSKNILLKLLLPVVSLSFYSSAVVAYEDSDDDSPPITLPLTIVDYQSYPSSVNINVGIGDLPPMPFKFDTGSTGLHALPLANITSGNGVRCTDTPTETDYGLPPYITFTGHVCYAHMHFGDYVTKEEVAFANLDKVICTTAGDPRCNLSNWGNGVFGAGLVGKMHGEGNVPNPLLSS